MRVLVISHLYPSPGHEGSLFVEDQVRALTNQGVEVSVLSPTGFAPRILWANPRLRRRGRTPRRAVRHGILVEYPRVLVLPRMLLFWRAGDLYYLGLRRFLPWLRGAGIDVIHAHQALPDGAAAQRLAAHLKVPYVVTVHGRDVHYHLRQSGRIAEAARRTLGSANAVMAVSQAVARALAPVVPPQRLHVVPNGVNAVASSSAGRERWADYERSAPLILSVSYLRAHKGHATVLEALARLRGQVRARYVIVGEGSERQHLERKATGLGIADQVEFLGWLPHDDVLGLMARADVFVLPSWDEAFGLVYAEAMAQGTPVVGCRGEGLEDFVTDGQTGYLVPPRDPEALANIIAQVLRNPAAAAAIGEAGRAAAAELTWARNAERQKAIYEQVVAEHARRDASHNRAADGLAAHNGDWQPEPRNGDDGPASPSDERPSKTPRRPASGL